MTTRIVLIRHGQTAWNREVRFRGRADLPLDEPAPEAMLTPLGGGPARIRCAGPRPSAYSSHGPAKGGHGARPVNLQR